MSHIKQTHTKTGVVIFAIVKPSGEALLAPHTPTEVIAGLLGEMGYTLLVVALPTQAEVMGRLTAAAEQKSCDAVILWSGPDHVIEQAQMLEKLNMPFVAKGHFESTHPKWHQIDFDHLGMARGAVELLGSRGHHRIAYIGHDNQEVYSQYLLRGFKDAISAVHPIALPSHFFLAIDELEHPRPQVAERVEYWYSLSARQRPTAAFVAVRGGAWSDLEVALRAHGQRIGFGPKDFHVAGIAPVFGRLYYGRAHCYPTVNLVTLGERMVKDLLWPILDGQPCPKVVSVLPMLVPFDEPYFADD